MGFIDTGFSARAKPGEEEGGFYLGRGHGRFITGAAEL
jgi:hypothetical protein